MHRSDVCAPHRWPTGRHSFVHQEVAPAGGAPLDPVKSSKGVVDERSEVQKEAGERKKKVRPERSKEQAKKAGGRVPEQAWLLSG